MLKKSEAQLIAEARVAAVEQNLAEMASEYQEIRQGVAAQETHAARVTVPAKHLKDPAAQADLRKTTSDLADACELLADNERRQAALRADLAVRKAELDGQITADWMQWRDEAERAGVAAVIEIHELKVKLMIVGQVHARQRAMTNELAAMITQRGVPVQQHKEIEVQEASKTYADFKKRLAEIDAKLADAAAYDPSRFMPKAPAPAASEPQADWRKTNKLSDFCAQLGGAQPPVQPQRVTPAANDRDANNNAVLPASIYGS